MAVLDRASGIRDLLTSSQHPRPSASRRDNVVMIALSLWFVIGLFLDSWAHANVPKLETFFTPWHAVFYSGFTATAAWVGWLVARQLQRGRRGAAAVPLGYGAALVVLPLFAISGVADGLWHTFLGIEQNTSIFFSPSHLGLLTSMILILLAPLRSAWVDPRLSERPSVRELWPALLALGLATSLVLLFLNYGNALTYRAANIVDSFSTTADHQSSWLAVKLVVTNLVLLAPILVVARRWWLPFGAVTIVVAPSIVVSAALTGFENLSTLGSVLIAGILGDLVARRIQPAGDRRTAFWVFGAVFAFLTWSLYFATASVVEWRIPTITEMWTGAPIVAGLVGWLFAALLLPDARPTRPQPDRN
ncbi:hypothetical protein [Antrihabitans stalactiti]|uniref:Uncharacterized protein n=1 Tax=Antrihabitans stalactiti TaxID=2584121 RepID=A0A848KDQ7_9NOCA|nr:hypothetical protein [Antrihabitans stalactiti]NMN95284.1 hypothetical protein [Antrihabitans stalactiti]